MLLTLLHPAFWDECHRETRGCAVSVPEDSGLPELQVKWSGFLFLS